MLPQLSIKTNSGTFVFADATCVPYFAELASEAIARLAFEKGFLLLEPGYDDPCDYSIEMIVNDEESTTNIDAYLSCGGTYRLELSTGSLWVGEPGQDSNAKTISLPAGTYSARIMMRNTSNDTSQQEYVRTELGEPHWKKYQKFRNVERIGCLALLLFVGLTIIPSTRVYWNLFLLVPSGLFLLAYLLKRTALYKKAMAARLRYEASLPTLLIFLNREVGLSLSVHGGMLPLR